MDSYQQRKEAKLKNANELIAHFQGIVKLKGDKWLLGLYMAKEWARFLQSSNLDLDEVKLFARTLEAERHNQGSGWIDLCVQVKQWVTEVEKAQTDTEQSSV